MKTVITLLVEHKTPIPANNTITDDLSQRLFNLLAQYGMQPDVTAQLAPLPPVAWERKK